MSLRSPLGQAKGLGSAKSGLHHWWLQKVTAFALIPLVVWFVYTVALAAKANTNIITLLSSPLHATALALLIGTGLFHGTLGIQVVIEDYVHGKISKLLSLLLLKVGAGFIGVAAIIAILYAHIHGPANIIENYPTDLASEASTSNVSVTIMESDTHKPMDINQ